MTQSEPTTKIATITTVKTNAAIFHVWVDAVHVQKENQMHHDLRTPSATQIGTVVAAGAAPDMTRAKGIEVKPPTGEAGDIGSHAAMGGVAVCPPV